MFNRSHRFHGHNSLNFTYKQGKAVRSQAITLRYAKNTRRDTYRVAVVVSKKVSKSAVTRNRIRRRVYEAVRAYAPAIHEPYDLIYMVYSEDVATIPAAQLQSTVAGLLNKAGITS